MKKKNEKSKKNAFQKVDVSGLMALFLNTASFRHHIAGKGDIYASCVGYLWRDCEMERQGTRSWLDLLGKLHACIQHLVLNNKKDSQLLELMAYIEEKFNEVRDKGSADILMEEIFRALTIYSDLIVHHVYAYDILCEMCRNLACYGSRAVCEEYARRIVRWIEAAPAADTALY